MIFLNFSNTVFMYYIKIFATNVFLSLCCLIEFCTNLCHCLLSNLIYDIWLLLLRLLLFFFVFSSHVCFIYFEGLSITMLLSLAPLNSHCIFLNNFNFNKSIKTWLNRLHFHEHNFLHTLLFSKRLCM